MNPYPFGEKQAPANGDLQQVAEGIFWLRMPLPFSLDHINLWLLEDGDGWTLVDTGLDLPDSRKLWERVINEHLGGKPIRRIVITHMHPDHVGLAGWLTGRFDCEFWMTRAEFFICHTLVKDTGQEAPEAAISFYRAAGYNEQAIADYKKHFGGFGKLVHPLPVSYRRIQDRDRLQINGRDWQVVVGSGHSPEHACLHCPELKLLISGDQVLPRISSNVSLFPTEPDANPLADWLGSCRKLADELPDDVLILPAHNEPFYGLHSRLSVLITSHEKTLERLVKHLATPSTAAGCMTTMFRREITGGLMQLAIGETLAHLNYLVQQGSVKRERNSLGVDYYVAI